MTEGIIIKDEKGMFLVAGIIILALALTPYLFGHEINILITIIEIFVSGLFIGTSATERSVRKNEN